MSASPPEAAEERTSVKVRYAQILLQKSFCTSGQNSAGRRFGFRVRMWRTSSLHVKRTGDFGNAAEGIRIGDQFPSLVFAKNSELCYFRLLQQNLPEPDSCTAAKSICIRSTLS